MEQQTAPQPEPEFLTADERLIAEPGKFRVVEKRYHDGVHRPFLVEKRGRDSDLRAAQSRFRSVCRQAFVELDRGCYSDVVIYDDRGNIMESEKVTP